MATNDSLFHVLISYIEHNGSLNSARFTISNNEPNVLDRVSEDSICGMGNVALFKSFIIEDLDRDTLLIQNFSTGPNGILDFNGQAYLEVNRVGTTNYCQLYVDVDPTAITVPTTVYYGFNLSDGFSFTPFDDSIVVMPAGTVTIDAEADFCINGTEKDLYELVDLPGGSFYDNTLGQDLSSNFLPANFYSAENTIDVTYTPEGCNLPANTTFNIYAAPVPSLVSSSDVTACSGADGAITASIANGSSNNVTFIWNNGNNTDLALTDLGVGTYVLNVFDDNGCKNKLIHNLSVQNLNIQAAIDDADCFGSATGSVTITGTSTLSTPITYLWSNGFNTPSINNVVAGTYTVHMTDANGCQVSKDYVVGQFAPVSFTSTVVEPDCGQSNGSVSISNPQGGFGSGYDYTWSTTATTPAITGIPYGIYTLTVSDLIGCSASETFNVTEVGGPIVFGFVTPAGCNNSNGGVNATAIPTLGGGNFVYEWSNNATTEDISGVPAGNYTLEVMDDNGCFGMQNFEVKVRPPAKNPICLVDVDRESNTNVVVWEKLETTGIAYYNIYRETATLNEFLLIDSVSATQSVSVFNDVIANPISTSWRYRISAVNECDVEGPLSGAHKTIHLTQSVSGNNLILNWDYYEGAQYSTVEISRKTNADPWSILDVVPATSTMYNDFLLAIPDTSGLDYDIGFQVAGGCTATGKAEDFNYVRSNRARGIFNPGFGTGQHSNNSLEELNNGKIALKYYPNPTADVLNIEMEANASAPFQLVSSLGQVMLTGDIHPGMSHFDVSDLPPGIYFINLVGENGMRFKFIKE